jgi:autotransporter-associated beta strand protein
MFLLSSRRNGRQPLITVVPKTSFPKWLSCLSARLAAIALGVALVSAPRFAQAQTYTWGGTGSTTTTTDYNLGTNWSTTSPGAPPVIGGQAAVFSSTGNATVNVPTGPISPGSWTFDATSQNYTISGALVTFSGTGPNLVNNANAGQTISISNNLFGSGISQNGPSTLVLSGGTNSFLTATIAAGTIKAGSTSAFGATSAVTVGTLGSTATLDLNGFSNTIGSLTGNGLGVVTNSGGVAAVLTTGDSTSTTFGGVIQDGASATGLTKTGTGTLTLSGNNTYSGATNVSAGTLQAGSATAFSFGLYRRDRRNT